MISPVHPEKISPAPPRWCSAVAGGAGVLEILSIIPQQQKGGDKKKLRRPDTAPTPPLSSHLTRALELFAVGVEDSWLDAEEGERGGAQLVGWVGWCGMYLLSSPRNDTHTHTHTHTHTYVGG